MEAAAHTEGGFGGVPQKVGKEFVKADKGKTMKKSGLYANIHAKRERISEGSGEKMRRVGSKGAPTSDAFKQSAKTAKMADGGDVNYSGVNRPDPLNRRIGANIAYKMPREGQTDFRNIPFGNNPESSNAQKPESKAAMDRDRANRPAMVKKLIKQSLGTHRKPALPKKSGGKVSNCW